MLAALMAMQAVLFPVSALELPARVAESDLKGTEPAGPPSSGK
jgi:hypothetical protein